MPSAHQIARKRAKEMAMDLGHRMSRFARFRSYAKDGEHYHWRSYCRICGTCVFVEEEGSYHGSALDGSCS